MEPSRPPSATAAEAPPPPAEVRQRYRLTYRRRPDAPALAQREQTAAWEAGLRASGLPVAGLDLPVPRPRLVFGAPLAVGTAAEAELVDLFLVERRPVADVRARLAASMPAGHELVDAWDVWLGEPPLSGQVVAAEYLVRLGTSTPGADTIRALDREAVERAARDLLGARTISRTRDKGGRQVTYDLRPLLEDITPLASSAARPESGISLRIRTRFDPERGVGRPEEVVAAIADALGVALEAQSIVRERLILGNGR